MPKLHFEHNVCKLSITVSPPLDHGLMWSICNSTDGSFAGDAPQLVHLKLPRFSTRKRHRKLIDRDVLCLQSSLAHAFCELRFEPAMCSSFPVIQSTT